MTVAWKDINGKPFAESIVVFGGSFNPPHRGHRAGLVAALERTKAKHAIVIPTSQNPLKSTRSSVTNEQRLEMTRANFAGLDKVVVSDFELKTEGASYTVETIEALRRACPLITQLWLLLGQDQLTGLHRWRNYEQLFTAVTPLVLGRGQALAPEALRETCKNLPQSIQEKIVTGFIPLAIDASSTTIREAIARGDLDAAKSQLMPEVWDIIERGRYYMVE